MKLILIRHGEPQTGPDAPQIDPPLTAARHKQAAAVVDTIKLHAPDVIFSSGLLRATQAAVPTAHALGLTILEDERFSEVDAGGLRYVDVQSIKSRTPEAWKAFLADPIGSHGADEGAMRAGLVSGIKSLLTTYVGKTVAVFSRAFPIDLITSALLGALGKDNLLHFNRAHGSITRLQGSRIDRMSLEAFGEAQHIQGLGPTIR